MGSFSAIAQVLLEKTASPRIDLPSDRGITPRGSSTLKVFISQKLPGFNPRTIAVKLPKLRQGDRQCL
ncbi:hypothetical protein Oscil6304_3970 [Oscillatoria acuminata PCC 6304]|uniref:Uncharacterized protein n=1 Tax=Oscillatoria acuminata PCC 6304 TaxID=56110 RepID=K9TMY6_9CYAN|nr:hypothetical protein Oscil6304_3970 [Oscillatoria acuminata PCC 6304]